MRRVAAILAAALVVAPSASADSEIHSIAVDGTDRRNLTQSPSTSDGVPRPSPDGSRIAFVRTGAAGEQDIWVMNADGSAQRPIARPGYDWNPVWSADGARIAFTRSWSVPARGGWAKWRFAIEIVDSTSGLTLKRLPDLRDPRFSPDGRWLTARGGQNGATLWLLDAAGRSRTLIAAFGYGEPTAHAWSPDSSKIAIEVQRVISFYRSARARPTGDGLYVFHLYGRTLQLIRGLAADPHWSPDGTLAFTWWRVEDGLVTNPAINVAQDVWQVVPGDPPRRTSDRSVTLFSSVPAWSPDGRLLAFSGREQFGSWGSIYLSNADGSGVRKLASDETGRSSTGAPVWMPDGRRIVFTCC